MRFGTVALVGRSNVGKSTFLNAALGERLAIVSPLPQTTRDPLLGIAHRPDAQIAFIDTPGLHRPRSELGRRMNAAALDAARTTDLVVMMTDIAAARATGAVDVLTEDRNVIALLPAEAPSLLLVNKIDLVRDKSLLLPMTDAYTRAHPFREVIPVSVQNKDDVERVLGAIAALLPEGPAAYDADTLTNRPVSFFVREYVREAVMLGSQREVPHAVAVSVDAIDETPRALVIKATLHVEKEGQRRILIGKGGERIKEIGTAARLRIEELVQRKVYLELFVRVTPRWKHVPRQLSELGYDAPDQPRRRRE
jgi:GTP-binding protein Era